MLLYLVLDHGSPYPRLDLENKSLPQWFRKVGTDIVNLADDSFLTRWNLIKGLRDMTVDTHRIEARQDEVSDVWKS